MTAKQIKDLLLKKKSEPGESVEQAEFAGVQGWLWGCSSYEMEGWRSFANNEDPDKKRLADAKLVQISFRDKSGSPVFDEKELPIIAGFRDSYIRPLVNAALRINGYSPEGLERIAKNLLAMYGVDGLFEGLASIGIRCPVCSKSTQPTSSQSSG